MTRSNNIISRLVDPKWCDATCALTQIEAADEIKYLRQICEELAHALTCPNPSCTLDWDGIHNWHDYRDQLAGRNKENQP